MSHPPESHSSRRRIVLGALALGLPMAAMSGLGVSGSAEAQVNQAGTTAGISMRFDPGLALMGFLLGAPIGGIAGALSNRRGIGGWIAFFMFILIGGFNGMLIAGLLGARTQVTVIGNAVAVDYGTPKPVLFAGVSIGLVVGALIAWRFRPKSTQRAGGAMGGFTDGPSRT